MLGCVPVCWLSANTRAHIKMDSDQGINPFSTQRFDEERTARCGIQGRAQPDMPRLMGRRVRIRRSLNRYSPSTILVRARRVLGVHPSLPWSGLWAASNQWKDVSDLASIKEQHSYAALERPYKFLKAVDKKSVDQDVRGVTAAMRNERPSPA